MIKINSLPQKRLFIEGFLVTLLGLVLLFFGKESPVIFIRLLLSILIIDLAVNIIGQLFKREKDRKKSLFFSLIEILLLIFILSSSFLDNFSIYFSVYLIAIYQIFMGVINLITYLIYRKNKVSHKIIYLVNCLFDFLLAFATFVTADKNVQIQFFLLGIYALLLGLNYFHDGIFFNNNSLQRINQRRRFHLSLPIIFTAFIPIETLNKVNKIFKTEEADKVAKFYDANKVGEEPILEVLIHTSDKTGIFGAIGHADICFKGRMISYGSYDPSSEHLFGSIGDGTLFNAAKEPYIQLCKKESKKTLFSYGMQLNDEQQVAVEARIKEIYAQAIPFSQRQNKDKKSYLYKLTHEADAHIYKFNSGKFKTYFVLSTNCVLLADSIIGRAGTDLLSMNGFITPGTLKSYLDQEFERPHGLVTSRKIY